MESIANLVVSSLAGGAAGGFVQILSEKGFKWLVELTTAQSPEMLAIANQNMENFVNRLAQRVERLEKEVPVIQSEVFQDSLIHPSSALLIKNAFVSAAITNNDEKHAILAELIVQRLTAGADDMIALAGAAACSAVSCLTTRQINILALLVAIQKIRPTVRFEGTGLTSTKDFINKWWLMNLFPFLSNDLLGEITQLDYEHLVSMGCLRISVGSYSLEKLITSEFTKSEINFDGAIFKDQFWY
ncbi:MAG: hypothetical protein HYX61_10240 [Gammaproteobacteria bacterium]|jgi:hypothetical protein|nr:hypothetical protein [Gammaproteobacteria bacterium]